MEIITHEYTDSLSRFLLENPTSNERDWLKQLDQDRLSNLIDLLRLIVEDRAIPGLNEYDCLNMYTDARLLAFKVYNIGKKRRISTIEYERQVKLLRKLLVDAQLILVDPKII